jgi:membrane associated rhomboid family serine protease
MIFALPLYDDNPIRRPPVVTWVLIGLCIGAFLWQLGQNDPDAVAYQYGMIPAVLFGHAQLQPGLAAIPGWVTIFTSMFLHSGFLHLGGNMLFLWIFGNNIEDVLGGLRYLLLYLVSGVAAAMAQALPDPASDIPMIGASGAIAGVLGAYLMLYPWANVHVFVWIVIFFRIVTLPAWLMLGLWFLMQLLSGLAAGAHSPGVAFWAHVGGFVAGIVLLAVLRPNEARFLQPARSAPFQTASPRALIGRRTFHGSVPEAGSYRPGPPWG